MFFSRLLESNFLVFEKTSWLLGSGITLTFQCRTFCKKNEVKLFNGTNRKTRTVIKNEETHITKVMISTLF